MSSLPPLREQAMRLLARREHSQFELQQKLLRKTDDQDAILSVIRDLGQSGLQSDARFAESFINARMRRGLGPNRIQNELRERKVDEDIINACLNFSFEHWVLQARQVFRKKTSNQFSNSYPQRAKIMNFLQYRGFSHAHINAALAAEEPDENIRD